MLRDGAHEERRVILSGVLEVHYIDATVGTNHVQGTPIAKAVEWLPGSLRHYLRRTFPETAGLRKITTEQPTLIVWLRPSRSIGSSTFRPSVRTAGGEQASGVREIHQIFLSTNQPSVGAMLFPIWPRRSDSLAIVFKKHSTKGHYLPEGFIRFDNPLAGSKADAGWQPEALPITKLDGDLEVTLKSFASGFGIDRFNHFGAEDAETAGRFEFSTRTPEGEERQWNLAGATLSDETGNRIEITSRLGSQTSITFRPVLWPDEPAWKLELEFKRHNSAGTDETRAVAFLVAPNWMEGTNSGEFVRTPDPR